MSKDLPSEREHFNSLLTEQVLSKINNNSHNITIKNYLMKTPKVALQAE